MLIIGGRKIRVLLNNVHPTKPKESIPPKDVPMEDLKVAEAKIQRAEGISEESEIVSGTSQASRTSEAGPTSSDKTGSYIQQSPSGRHMNENTNCHIEEDKDEITPSPIQEHHGRDIRFVDLPQPRKHERENSEGIASGPLFYLLSDMVVMRNETRIGDSAEDAIGVRTPIIDDSPSRRNSFGPRLRKAATFEKVLSKAFGKRRRDESPSSRRSTRTQMTLQYFSFQPTIGRNSVQTLILRRFD